MSPYLSSSAIFGIHIGNHFFGSLLGGERIVQAPHIMSISDIPCPRTLFLSQHNPLHKQILRYILTGAIDHASRLYISLEWFPPQYVLSCPFCSQSDETAQHIFLGCSAWTLIMRDFPILMTYFQLMVMVYYGIWAILIVVGFIPIFLTVLKCWRIGKMTTTLIPFQHKLMTCIYVFWLHGY